MMLIIVLLSTLHALHAYDYTCNFTHNNWARHPRLYLNQRQVLAPTAHSFSLIVDSEDSVVSRAILQTGTWQPQMLTLIVNLVKPGQKAINLGSQTGFQAIVMGKIVGQGGQMYIFEPYSISYKMAVKNLHLNGLEPISRVYKIGAGERKSFMKLWIDHDNTGHSSLVEEQFSQKAYEEIEVDRVDSIVEQAVDFALIDVEMFEVSALLGMEGILSKSATIIILVEWRYMDNPSRSFKKTEQLLEWLANKQYRWFRYSPKEDACQLGTIKQISSQQLLQIKEEDLLLAGPHATLDMFTLQ